MKTKILSLIILCSVMLFYSCSKESVDNNPLTGTKWASNYDSYVSGTRYFVLEFSEKEVLGYFADENLLVKDESRVTSSSYTIDGNNISMENLVIYYDSYTQMRFKNTVLNGNFIETQSEYTLVDNWKDWLDLTFQKL